VSADRYTIHVRLSGVWRDPIECIGARSACEWVKAHYTNAAGYIEMQVTNYDWRVPFNKAAIDADGIFIVELKRSE